LIQRQVQGEHIDPRLAGKPAFDVRIDQLAGGVFGELCLAADRCNSSKVGRSGIPLVTQNQRPLRKVPDISIRTSFARFRSDPRPFVVRAGVKHQFALNATYLRGHDRFVDHGESSARAAPDFARKHTQPLQVHLARMIHNRD
jgi:hypothetical protein